jgi:hypothetical protein
LPLEHAPSYSLFCCVCRALLHELLQTDMHCKHHQLLGMPMPSLIGDSFARINANPICNIYASQTQCVTSHGPIISGHEKRRLSVAMGVVMAFRWSEYLLWCTLAIWLPRMGDESISDTVFCRGYILSLPHVHHSVDAKPLVRVRADTNHCRSSSFSSLFEKYFSGNHFPVLLSSFYPQNGIG